MYLTKYFLEVDSQVFPESHALGLINFSLFFGFTSTNSLSWIGVEDLLILQCFLPPLSGKIVN